MLIRASAAIAVLAFHAGLFWFCSRPGPEALQARQWAQRVIEVVLPSPGVAHVPPDYVAGSAPRRSGVLNPPLPLAQPDGPTGTVAARALPASAHSPAPGARAEGEPLALPAAPPMSMREEPERALIPLDESPFDDRRTVLCPEPPPSGPQGERCRRTAELAARTGVARTPEREQELDREAHRKEVLVRYRDNWAPSWPKVRVSSQMQVAGVNAWSTGKGYSTPWLRLSMNARAHLGTLSWAKPEPARLNSLLMRFV